MGAAGEPDPGPAAQAVRLLTALLSHHMAATQQAAALVATHVIPALRLAAQVLSYLYLFQIVLWIRIGPQLGSRMNPDTRIFFIKR